MFQQAQKQYRYNLRLLYKGQIVGEQTNEDVITTMVGEDLGFLDELRALYQSIRGACDIHRE